MEKLRKYLMDVLGTGPRLHRLEQERVRGLPVYLLSLYDFYEISLFRRELVLAEATKGAETDVTPGEYATQLATIQRTVRVSTVLVLPSLTSYGRRALIKRGVPFIVPGRQFFLPQLMIDLREHFPRPGPSAGHVLSAGAQCVLLAHLVRQPIEGLSMRRLADLLDYSPMAISKVGKELEKSGLCELEAVGRSRRFRFVAEGRGLWERAEALLSSPVKKQRWLVNCHRQIPGMAAGLTALSAETDISDDRIPTHAVFERKLRELEANGAVTFAETHDDAIASLEGWAYDPIVLAQGERVDPLSLYLSLRESPDERVQGALEGLLEDVTW